MPLLRYLVGIVVLLALISSVDLKQILKVFQSISMNWFIGSIGLIAIIRFLMGLRWFRILRTCGSNVSMWRTVHINYLSGSIGMVTPGGVGGDILRGVLINHDLRMATRIARTIFIDRLVGIYSLACLCLVGIFMVSQADFQNPLPLWFVVLNVALVVVLPFAVWVASKTRFKLAFIHTKLSRLDRIWAKFNASNESFLLLAEIFVISVVVQLLRCWIVYFLFRAFGVQFDFWYFIVFAPIVFLATMLPVSPAGIGVREGMMVLLFGLIGAETADCIAVGLSFQVAQIVVAIPGAAMWMLGLVSTPKQSDVV